MKLAQVHPARMCSPMANCISICWDTLLPQFMANFNLTAPVGQPLHWRD